VPFPFPFAQFLQWALYAFILVCPLIVVNDIDDVEGDGLAVHWMSLPINFLACSGYAALNEISVELEEPFGDDDNDYPVHVQQWSVVQSLEDCYFQDTPTDFGMQFFGSSRPFSQELDVIMARGKERARTEARVPNPAPEKATQEAQHAELAAKFDEVRSAIAASSLWLRKHEEDPRKPDVMGAEVRVGELLEALTRSTRKQGQQGEEEEEEGQAHGSAQAETADGKVHSRRRQELLNDLFQLDSGTPAPAGSAEKSCRPAGSSESIGGAASGDRRHRPSAASGDQEEVEELELLDGEVPEDLRRVLHDEYGEEEGTRLLQLLDQHLASGQLLRSAKAASDASRLSTRHLAFAG